MRFAVALPTWGYVLAFIAALGFAWLAYARVAVRLTPAQRAALTALRAELRALTNLIDMRTRETN